jgi:hypothetical protein
MAKVLKPAREKLIIKVPADARIRKIQSPFITPVLNSSIDLL